jgi:hypothetical protein
MNFNPRPVEDLDFSEIRGVQGSSLENTMQTLMLDDLDIPAIPKSGFNYQ